MSVSLDTADPTRVPTVCRLLRTKTAFAGYSPDDGPTPWQQGESSTAVYWCLFTMETSGPDNQYAHPKLCDSSRSCYQAARD